MKQKKKYLEQLISILMTIDDKKEMEDFLRGLLTPAELEEIPQRLQIVVRLLKGETQRQVAANLGVGLATVTRGARELKNGRFKILRRLLGGRGNLKWRRFFGFED